MQLKETFEKVKRASKSLALLSDEQRRGTEENRIGSSPRSGAAVP